MLRPIGEINFSLSAAATLLSADRLGDEEVVFTGIVQSDSEVEPGDIFIALPGEKHHGASFITNAVKNGAVAILTDEAGAKLANGIPTLIVTKPREAAGILATAFYREPIRSMQSIGITGTNGKTTVATLLHKIFSSVGREAGLIGTIETRIGLDQIKSVRTTPEASDLQVLAATMRERHLRHLVMEVSSHSIELKRIIGSHFSVVGFTNLSQDHLDFHNDMESYFQAKAALFTHEYADYAFINIDNSYGERLFNSCEISTVSLSRLNTKAEWHFAEIYPTSSGFDFTIRGRGGILIESSTPMYGDFNLDNLLMAVAIAHHFEVDPLELSAIIPTIYGAPGRLESINAGQDFKVLVDYAHSPDAVSSVISAVRKFTPNHLIVLLGCGGDRDSSKRSPMGQALHDGSDIAIFTSDNPRSEAPAAILAEMTSTLTIKEPSRIIEDRGAAISYAISLAQSGDTVLILGKGHESGQEIAGVVQEFDDRAEATRAVQTLAGRR